MSPLQVKVSMDPPVTVGVLVMITPAAVDGGRQTTALRVHDCCMTLTQIHYLNFITHSSTVDSSDGHIVGCVVRDGDLCRGGFHVD